jgi:hypothetical protein
MSTTTDQTRRFTALLHEANRPEQAIGTVLVDPMSMLTVEAAMPGFTEKLDEIASRMNAIRYEHTPARPPEDAPKYALYSNVIERGNAAFLPALLDHLRRTYDLELRPS